MKKYEEKLRQLLLNRYGVDVLSRDLSYLAMFIILINIFLKIKYLSLLAISILIFSYYRIFSKNFQKRYNENRIYTNYRPQFTKVKNFFKYKQFKCPNCKQKLRVPRGRKKIVVTCPKCRHQFDKRS